MCFKQSIFHQSHSFLAIPLDSPCNILTQNSQHLIFLLLLMTLEYLLILETHLKLSQKQNNSLIKKFFEYIKREKHSKEGSSAPYDPHPTAMAH